MSSDVCCDVPQIHVKTDIVRFLLFLNCVLVVFLFGLLIVSIIMHARNQEGVGFVDWALSMCFFISLVLVVLENLIEDKRINKIMDEHKH